MILNPTTIEEIAQNREEWAAALESGKYDQAFGVYRNPVGPDPSRLCLCSVGVLIDISMPGRWMGSRFCADRPAPVMTWEMERVVGCSADPIIQANDKQRKNHAEIAAMIRALPLPEAVTP